MPSLVHDLALVTPTSDGTYDDYGQPVAGDPIVVLLAGLVQPIGGRERPQVNQAGPEMWDHRIFLGLRADPAPGAYLRFEPDDGVRYEVVGTDRFDFGNLPHLEVRCRRIASQSRDVVSGS